MRICRNITSNHLWSPPLHSLEKIFTWLTILVGWLPAADSGCCMAPCLPWRLELKSKHLKETCWKSIVKSCHSGLVHDKKYAYILTICLVNDLKYHCIGTSSSLALTYNSSSVWFCLLSGCTDFSDLCRINMYDPKPSKGKRLSQASTVG